jgi:predicted RNA-binding Zn ribbon-like protein
VVSETESGSRDRAPGALALVQAFVNTVDFEPSKEDLRTPGQLYQWLCDHGLVEDGQSLDQQDLDRTLEFREALRALLLANNGGDLTADAIETINRVGHNARFVVRFDADGRSRLEPSVAGVDAAFARLLAIVNTAMTEGTWPRLKACRSHTCQWAFYDASKNRSGAWCSMAVCGSRSKARSYRERRREK